MGYIPIFGLYNIAFFSPIFNRSQIFFQGNILD